MLQKNSPTKTSAVSAVIASACIVVYVAALVSTAFRIYVSVDQRRTAAEQEFFDIADLATSAGVLGFMDEPFIETINDALIASITLEGLIISGPGGEYAFERERGKAINWVNSSPRFKSRFDFSGQALYRNLQIAGLRNVTIQAVAGALDYPLLTSILKQTLLVVLAALTLAFFTLVMESLLGKSTDKRRYAPYEDGGDEVPYRSPEPPAAEAQTAGRTVSHNAAAEGMRHEEAAVVARPAPVETPPPKAEEPEPFIPPKDDAPKGLYSPHGNIGWEEYTADRLESELHRCASYEQDLVFIMMEYKFSKNLSGAFYNQFAEEAVRFFTTRDMLFEKGERGMAVIFPNIDLESGFAKSDEFHSRILNKFPGAFKSKTDFCIGLSSRSGRLVDAKRLMFEASEALERALVDPVSHIVAFKSDPDKYRAFIASQKKKRL